MRMPGSACGSGFDMFNNFGGLGVGGGGGGNNNLQQNLNGSGGTGGGSNNNNDQNNALLALLLREQQRQHQQQGQRQQQQQALPLLFGGGRQQLPTRPQHLTFASPQQSLATTDSNHLLLQAQQQLQLQQLLNLNNPSRQLTAQATSSDAGNANPLFQPARSVQSANPQRSQSQSQPQPQPQATNTAPNEPDASLEKIKAKIMSDAENAANSGVTSLSKMNPKKLFVLIRILLAYLEKRDPVLHAHCENIIRECRKKKKEGHIAYGSLSQAIGTRLRLAVGDEHWLKACEIHKRLQTGHANLRNSPKAQAAASAASAPASAAAAPSPSSGSAGAKKKVGAMPLSMKRKSAALIRRHPGASGPSAGAATKDDAAGATPLAAPTAAASARSQSTTPPTSNTSAEVKEEKDAQLSSGTNQGAEMESAEERIVSFQL